MAQDHSPQTTKAVAFLRSHIERRRKERVWCLPPITTLAREAGVSVVTMHRAVTILKDENLLVASPRRGIRICQHCASGAQTDNAGDTETAFPSRTPKEREPRWRQVQRALWEDIIRGDFPLDSLLPTGKELCARYDTCPSVLRRALSALADEGKILPAKRRFRVPGITSSRGRGTVVVISFHDNVNFLSSSTSLLCDVFRELERRQSTVGFEMKLVAWFSILRGRITIEELERKHSVIGYIILTLSLSKCHIDELLDMVTRSRKPVALLDDTRLFRGRELARRAFPLVRVFGLPSMDEHAGTEMAYHLFQHGHRHVTYLSTWPGQQWSALRLRGVEAVYASAVADVSVRHIFCDVGELDLGLSLKSRCELFPLEDETRSQPATLYYRERVRRLHEDHAYERALEPIFDEALALSEVTAWIGAHDRIALYAYFFLADHGKVVPENIALAGFDNSNEAFGYNMTSYDFNYGGAAVAALSYVFTPVSAILRQKRSYEAVRGSVVQRRSTGFRHST